MKNVTDTQREYLDRLMQHDKGATVRWHDGHGTASLLRGALIAPEQVKGIIEENPEAILDIFLEEYGPLVATEDSKETIRFVKTHSAKGGGIRIRAMQVAKGIPIHGATLLLFANTRTGVYRAQSGCYRDVDVPPLTYRRGRPVDPKRREASLRRRLTRKLQADEQGARFIKRKIKEGFGEDEIAAEELRLSGQGVTAVVIRLFSICCQHCCRMGNHLFS